MKCWQAQCSGLLCNWPALQWIHVHVMSMRHLLWHNILSSSSYILATPSSQTFRGGCIDLTLRIMHSALNCCWHFNQLSTPPLTILGRKKLLHQQMGETLIMNTEQVLEGRLAHSFSKIIVVGSSLEPMVSSDTDSQTDLQYQTWAPPTTWN